jgi:hypothetical protein
MAVPFRVGTTVLTQALGRRDHAQAPIRNTSRPRMRETKGPRPTVSRPLGQPVVISEKSPFHAICAGQQGSPEVAIE